MSKPDNSEIASRQFSGFHSAGSVKSSTPATSAPAPLTSVWSPVSCDGYAVARPIILMCPPDFFEPAPPHPIYGYANAFEKAGRELFENDPAGFRALAMEQWLALEEIFKQHAQVIRMVPVRGWYDQVYTADPSFSVSVYNGSPTPRNVTILSDFSNEKRNPEVDTHRVALEALNDNRIIVPSRHKIEGNGDNVPDSYRGIIWSGYTTPATFANAQHGRSSLLAHKTLREQTGLEVVSLRTRAPFYHDDTVLGPLSKGHMLAHYKSLHPVSHQTFLKKAFHDFGLDVEKYLIDISDEDAHRLAVNVRCFGDRVIMPMCSQKLQDRVKSKGYDVKAVNIDAFLAGGGSVHCLSNVVNEPISARH